jgi:hypothetical protein
VVAVGVIALCVQCNPGPASQQATVLSRVERHEERASNEASEIEVQEPGPTPESEVREPEPKVTKEPSQEALRIGPELDERARAAGIKRLAHVPFKWPGRDTGPRRAGEPVVIPVGRPFPLPLTGGPESGAYDSEFGYLQQLTITGAGALRMDHGFVDFGEWTKEDASGAPVLTPPKEWEGIVQLNDLRDGTNFSGTALVAFGKQGLVNYREYQRRYVPWRMKRREIPPSSGATTYVDIETRLATVMTGDIDADGTPELISYTFVRWVDEKKQTVSLEGEIGVVWKDVKKEPAALAGFTWQPGSFTIPYAVPARLNGGRALVYSVEYCCAGSGFRAASLAVGSYANARWGGEDGEWEIFLEPSDTGDATLLIATGRSVNWDAMTEKWAF